MSLIVWDLPTSSMNSLFWCRHSITLSIKLGASTFENVGTLCYNAGDTISLNCSKYLPTDGLVLRGTYSALTLAVYGIVTDLQERETVYMFNLVIFKLFCWPCWISFRVLGIQWRINVSQLFWRQIQQKQNS